jgi:hypothetical protein
MNKELIKKYKTEFDHWLYGGKLQVKFVNDPWEEAPEDIFSYNVVNFVLVIDDEYVEFRKALAEGKAIECLDWNDKWQDLIENDIKFENIDLSRLRITPEDPKFKEGDWVRDKVNGKVVQLTEHFHPGGIELWKPKNKEYFWYKNDLVKFDESQTNAGLLLHSARGCSYHVPANFEKYCEPFIGNLPSNLK